MKLEMLFGGLLALFVLGAAMFFAVSFPTSGEPQTAADATQSGDQDARPPIEAVRASYVCQCFDNGFALAGTGVDVTSAQYREGYEQCRAIAYPQAGDAWTAGWNARLSDGADQADCLFYWRKEKLWKKLFYWPEEQRWKTTKPEIAG